MHSLQIVGYKQYLVRPLGQLGKDHPPSTTTSLNNNAGENEECNDLTSHITETLLQKAGKPLNEVIDEVSFFSIIFLFFIVLMKLVYIVIFF